MECSANLGPQVEREIERERERQRDRETERHRDTETQRHRETERQRGRETERAGSVSEVSEVIDRKSTRLNSSHL